MNSLQFKSCIIYHVGASSCAPAPLQTEPASLGFNGSPEIINVSLVCDSVTALQAVS